MAFRVSCGSSPSRLELGQGVGSFTLKDTATTMQTEDLLAVTPDALVKAIVRRREALAAKLPEELQRRTEENDRAYVLAKEGAEQNGGASSQANTAEENETFRRRTVSRLWSVRHAAEDTNEALNFWKEMEKGEWGHLLEDATRVQQGGKSSYALRKKTEVDDL
jgi:hypothetical protein